MPRVRDRDAVRRILETDRGWTAYALADLDPAHWPFCEWHAAPGSAVSLVLLYRAFDIPVLLAVGDPAELAPLLFEVQEPRVYLSVRPEVIPLLADLRFRIESQRFMCRMVLDRERLGAPGADAAVRLFPEDLEELQGLYLDGVESAEAPEFFQPAMLAAGVYFGVREGGRLVAAAGTHVVNPEESVAAVACVYTRRDCRNRGLAAACAGAVSRELVRSGIRTVVLNVGRENLPAVAVYRRLGYRLHCEYREGVAGQ